MNRYPLSEASFYSLVGEYKLKFIEDDTIFFIKTYYPSGQIYSEGHYLSQDGLIRKGPFTTYYLNGQKKEEGTFDGGITKIGSWNSWYSSSQLKDEINYIGIESARNSKFLITSHYDSVGTPLVEYGNGNYRSYYEDGSVESEGNAKYGMKEGEWKGYNTTGVVRYEEVYDKGQIVKGVSYDSYGNKYPYSEIETQAEPYDGIQGFYTFVAKNLKYPKKARKKRIQGKVYVQFIVNTNGELIMPEILKGIGGGCDEEVLRVISIAPKWKPPLQRGREVKQRIVLPITFKLG